jgi:hypothetical protein
MRLQAPAYLFVYGSVWLVTIGVVAYCGSVTGFTPLESKGAALAVTLPMGFLGHKYITFGGQRRGDTANAVS